MNDSAASVTAHVKAWRVRVRRGGAKELMSRLVEDAAREGEELIVVDSKMVFGLDHVKSAYYHAKRAITENRNSSDSVAMESLLYLSGERQLGTAIKKMSVDEATEEVVVAHLEGRATMPENDWRLLAATDEDCSPPRLLAFGITEEETRTTARSKLAELVLERVAAVDILKK